MKFEEFSRLYSESPEAVWGLSKTDLVEALADDIQGPEHKGPGTNNFCIGPHTGRNIKEESYMLCLKFEGWKEFRKQLTPKQMAVIKDIFYGERLVPEEEHSMIKAARDAAKELNRLNEIETTEDEKEDLYTLDLGKKMSSVPFPSVLGGKMSSVPSPPGNTGLGG